MWKVDEKDDMYKCLWEKRSMRKTRWTNLYQKKEMRNKIWVKVDEKKSMRKTYWAHAEKLSRKHKNLLLGAQCVTNHWKLHLEDQVHLKQVLGVESTRMICFVSTSEKKRLKKNNLIETLKALLFHKITNEANLTLRFQ